MLGSGWNRVDATGGHIEARGGRLWFVLGPRLRARIGPGAPSRVPAEPLSCIGSTPGTAPTVGGFFHPQTGRFCQPAVPREWHRAIRGGGLGVEEPVDDGWISFPCPGSVHRWRHLPDGRIELEGAGTPTAPWPADVNEWENLIFAAADKYELLAHWIAAIMAIESGGKVGTCRRMPDGSCAQNEGAGLMALVPFTASGLAGRKVTSEELIADHALSIDLGAKALRRYLDAPFEGPGFCKGTCVPVPDFVGAAVAYNACCVKCGQGGVWRPPGSGLPRAPCPPTGWGVIMGCVESPAGSGNIVVNDYPERAIRYANAAIENGFAVGGAPGPVPPVPPPKRASVVEGTGFLGLLALAGGAYAGFWVAGKARQRWTTRTR